MFSKLEFIEAELFDRTLKTKEKIKISYCTGEHCFIDFSHSGFNYSYSSFKSMLEDFEFTEFEPLTDLITIERKKPKTPLQKIIIKLFKL